MCISHFPWLSFFLLYFWSYSVHFSFFTFFSDFVIFQVVKWIIHISMSFIFLVKFHVLQWTFLNFLTFSVFLAIFHVVKCVFLIFYDFQFSRHNPGPTVCISHFSSFPGFLAIFQILQCAFLSLHVFECFLPYYRSYRFVSHLLCFSVFLT